MEPAQIEEFTMESRLKRVFALSLVFAVFVFGVTRRESNASSPNSNNVKQTVVALQHQVADLNALVQQQAATIRTLQSRADAQQNVVAGLHDIVASHDEKLQFVTVEGNEMYITRANLNIRNGSGSTSGDPDAPYANEPNGLGNLIIGYNENGVPPCASGCLPQPKRDRSGSHNLIMGEDNGYTSIGGIVVGFANSISAPYATITGGAYNASSGSFSTVTGGEINLATGEGASVSGGFGGVASGRWSSVSGGQSNTAEGEVSSVSGGGVNAASGLQSSISGGAGNKITSNGQDSSISGGAYRTMDNQFTWAGGSLVSH